MAVSAPGYPSVSKKSRPEHRIDSGSAFPLLYCTTSALPCKDLSPPKKLPDPPLLPAFPALSDAAIVQDSPRGIAHRAPGIPSKRVRFSLSPAVLCIFFGGGQKKEPSPDIIFWGVPAPLCCACEGGVYGFSYFIRMRSISLIQLQYGVMSGVTVLTSTRSGLKTVMFWRW